jgi:GYF domain 2
VSGAAPMIDFGCPRCGTQQRAPDSAAGKEASCARCGQRLRVPEAQPLQAVLVEPEAAPTTIAGQWFYALGEKQYGPVNWAELQRMAAEGQLSKEDRVWSEGMVNWQDAGTVPRLFPTEAPRPRPQPAKKRKKVEPIDDEVLAVEPIDEGDSATFSRVCLGAVLGLVLPFLALFVLIVDLGLNALLGIKHRTPGDSLLVDLFPGNSGLRMVFVVIVAILAVVLGIVVGNAIGPDHGGLIGAGVGYLLGSMTGGALSELLMGRRREKGGRKSKSG